LNRETIFKYERVEDGKAISMEELKEEVGKTWPVHQTYIDKVLRGLGMEGWKVRFLPYRYKFWGGGGLVSQISLIMIESHTKNEMLTTLLHEILHYRNPGASEEEIEERSIAWFKVLNGNTSYEPGGRSSY